MKDSTHGPEERRLGVVEGEYDIPSTVEELDECNDEIVAMFGVDDYTYADSGDNKK